MSRVKRAKSHLKKRRTIRKATKGYKWGRKNTIRLGRTAMLKAGQHALQDRHKKKGKFRQLWQIRINAAARENGLSYSRLIDGLIKNKISLDRKILADLAVNNPKIFAALVKLVKGDETPAKAKTKSKTTSKK